ncbi:hypothetical protein THOM_2483 [Trachipleistophora hominis]|uniref:Uncharacterized protein n=1 Tax=Trachipleistophora hominis TaxID=72359 RepID=L7JU48_TRAHO|nr:hypothetical protein THOM_2483 [Trachipleistophora hominis]
MQKYEDADEYEKNFLKKYLTRKAEDKLNELEKRLKKRYGYKKRTNNGADGKNAPRTGALTQTG